MSTADPTHLATALTREQSRAIDRLAIDRFGIPGVVLMENAGINASDVAAGMLEAIEGNKVAIICGGGNNGGDGFVIARHLHNAGRKVVVYNATDPSKLTGDAVINYGICLSMDIKLMRCDDAQSLAEQSPHWAAADLVIDAVLGTGFDVSRGLSVHLAAVIAAINDAGFDGDLPSDTLILSVDVPSGLDCDTGQTSRAPNAAAQAVHADATVTFVTEKVGFSVEGASAFTGEVFTAGIGVPPALVREVCEGG